MAGNYPRIPGITLGLGLVHYPLSLAISRFALLAQSGWSAPPPRWSRDGETNNMSQFRWHHTRQRRVLLRRPAGFVIAVDDPIGRSHRPRAYATSYQQRYEVKIDGPMQFAFADPLGLPTSGHRLTVCRCVRRVRGLPTLRQATFRTLRRPEVQRRLWAASDSSTISFVSHFSFANKRLEPQRFIASDRRKNARVLSITT